MNKKYKDIEYKNIITYDYDCSPMKPAYCLYNYETKNELIFIMRGSKHWADGITDLNFFYLDFIIYHNPISNIYQLKIVHDFMDN